MKTTRRLFTKNMKIFLIVLNSVTLSASLVAAIIIYNNNKTDGFGSGHIVVTSCSTVNWAEKTYQCTGDYFSSGGGMVSRSNVSVTATHVQPEKGDVVTDVYPSAFSTNQTAATFVTGKERASVRYNLFWIGCVFFGGIVAAVSLCLYGMVTSKRFRP